MTRLEQSEFLAGPQLLVVDIQFDTEESVQLRRRQRRVHFFNVTARWRF